MSHRCLSLGFQSPPPKHTALLQKGIHFWLLFSSPGEVLGIFGSMRGEERSRKESRPPGLGPPVDGVAPGHPAQCGAPDC